MTSPSLRTCYAVLGLCAVTHAIAGGHAGSASEAANPAPPGYSNKRTGSVHDFDYFAGAWTTRQHRLKARGAASTEWEDFPATLCMTLYFGGMATIVPVVGGFEGQRSEFYAADEDHGRPIKVRYTWDKIDQNHARWEQAFSYDNRTWETNWMADFQRADPARTCENGSPRR